VTNEGQAVVVPVAGIEVDDGADIAHGDVRAGSRVEEAIITCTSDRCDPVVSATGAVVAVQLRVVEPQVSRRLSAGKAWRNWSGDCRWRPGAVPKRD